MRLMKWKKKGFKERLGRRGNKSSFFFEGVVRLWLV